jgi:hypothetical protein
MSLRILISGSLATAPERKTAASGVEYVRAHVRVDAKGAQFLASVSAFGDHIAEFLKLQKTDSVSVAGPARLSRWRGRDGVECFGLSVTAEQITTLRNLKRAHRDASRKPRRPKLTLSKPATPNGELPDDLIDDLYRDGEP